MNIKQLNVAYQGEPGANSEMAIEQYFGEGVESLPCPAFEDVFDAVESGRARWGMLPLENTLTGSIVENLDLLRARSLSIVGETVLQIEHHLLALPGVAPDELRSVYSHPQGLLQCRQFIKAHPNLGPEVTEDTAGAARQVAQWQDRKRGAIANGRAAALYGLNILAPAIGDRKDNFTRFVVLEKDAECLRPGGKMSLMFELEHRPSTLFEALGIFSRHHVNLTKIMSRPIPESPFSYWFFVEGEADEQQAPGPGFLTELREAFKAFKVLGCYKPAGDRHQPDEV